MILTILLLIGIKPIQALAATELTAEVDNQSPVVGGRITYTVTITGGTSLPEVNPPDFDGFDVVMGPSTSSSFQVINGRVSQSRALTYVLRALKAGRLTIEPATAREKRGIYKSNSIIVDVRDPSGTTGKTTGRKSVADAAVSSRTTLPDVFITASADKDTVYKQEMVVVTYQLYLRVNVTGYEFGKLPKARGFWQEELRTSRQPKLRDATVRGRSYKVAVLRKIGLFPTRTGKLTLDPLTVDCQVKLPSKQRRRSGDPLDWFFDDPFSSRSRREMRSVTTDPLTLTVLDLPALNRPSTFKGDVGDFQLRVSFDKRKLAQHDAVTVNVILSGNGYLKSIDAPKLNLPSGFDQFDPTVDENISVTDGGMKGRRTFTYLIIPRRAGTFKLEPVIFSFFNPESRTYKTIKGDQTTLTITPSEGSLASGGWIEKSEVSLLDSDIRFIKELSSPLFAAAQPFYSSVWFYLALGASPLLFLLGLGTESIIIRRTSDPAALRRRRAPEMMRRSLKIAYRALKQGSFGQAVDIAGKGLTELAGAVAGAPTAGLTSDLLRERLSKTGMEHDLILEIITLIQEADRIKFSSVIPEAQTTADLLNRFKEAAQQLERVR